MTVHIRFDGNCREVFEFYKDVFEQEPSFQTYGESPMASQTPSKMKDKIFHATINKGNIMLMGADTIGPDKLQRGNKIILCLLCESKKEIETLFQKLS